MKYQMKIFKKIFTNLLRSILLLYYIAVIESTEIGKSHNVELKNVDYLDIMNRSRKRFKHHLRYQPYKKKKNDVSEELSSQFKNCCLLNREKTKYDLKRHLLEKLNEPIEMEEIDGIFINDSLMEHFLGCTSRTNSNPIEKNDIKKTSFIYNLNIFLTEKDESKSLNSESLLDINKNPNAQINLGQWKAQSWTPNRTMDPLIKTTFQKENENAETHRHMFPNIEKKNTHEELSLDYSSTPIYNSDAFLFDASEKKEESI